MMLIVTELFYVEQTIALIPFLVIMTAAMTLLQVRKNQIDSPRWERQNIIILNIHCNNF